MKYLVMLGSMTKQAEQANKQLLIVTEVYLRPFQTSIMKFFVKIV